MSHYIAFFKKELLESTRTYKMPILLSIFFVFGIMSPLAAKLTPELLSAFMPEGMSISLPEPSAFDSWAQFFKNISQMGLIIMVIVFSGTLSSEISKATLINMLTKGLLRPAVIISKYFCMALVWTLSLMVSFLVTLGYTTYLFSGDGIANLLFSVFCLWLFGMFLLALLLFSSTVASGNYAGLLVTGGVVVAFMICGIMPNFHEYSPLSLASKNMDLITNAIEASSIYASILISGALTLALVVLSVAIFRKKQL